MQKEEGELECALEDARNKFNERMEAIRLRLEEQATEVDNNHTSISVHYNHIAAILYRST